MLTIVYTDCAHTSFGDYGAAAEVMYALQAYCNKNNINNTCILTSSEKGVSVYKRLFKADAKSNYISVYDQTFEVMELAHFAVDPRMMQQPIYVEIGNCKSAPLELITSMADNLRIIMFLALPLYPVDLHKQHIPLFYGTVPNIESKLVRHCLGFGPERLGFPVQSGFIQPLEDNSFKGITAQKYGLARFAYVKHEKKEMESFLTGYLLTSHYIYNCRHYIIVGQSDAIMIKALENFQRSLKKPFHIYLQNVTQNNDKYFYSDRSGQSTTKPVETYPNVNDVQDDAIYVWCIDFMPRELLRSLISSAIPYVATTGLLSYLEAIALNKISLYQYLDINETFINDYLAALSKILSKDSFQLANLLICKKASNDGYDKQFKTLLQLMTDKNSEELIEAHNILLQNPDKVIYPLAKLLNLSKPSKNLTPTDVVARFLNPASIIKFTFYNRLNQNFSEQTPLNTNKASQKLGL